MPLLKINCLVQTFRFNFRIESIDFFSNFNSRLDGCVDAVRLRPAGENRDYWLQVFCKSSERENVRIPFPGQPEAKALSTRNQSTPREYRSSEPSS